MEIPKFNLERFAKEILRLLGSKGIRIHELQLEILADGSVRIVKCFGLGNDNREFTTRGRKHLEVQNSSLAETQSGESV